MFFKRFWEGEGEFGFGSLVGLFGCTFGTGNADFEIFYSLADVDVRYYGLGEVYDPKKNGSGELVSFSCLAFLAFVLGGWDGRRGGGSLVDEV